MINFLFLLLSKIIVRLITIEPEEPPAAPEPEPQAIMYETTRKTTKIIVELITIASAALPKPTLKIINDPEAVPKPTPKIIDESPAEPTPDPTPPATRASDTSQDTAEVQDRTRPRIKHKIYRPNVKYKEVEHLLATTEGDHQLVTTEGGNIYRGMTGWLRGCDGILHEAQPTDLLSYSLYWLLLATREDAHRKDGRRQEKREKRWTSIMM